MSEKNPKKHKGCWIALIVALVVISILALGGFAVIKSYLGQISRTYDQSLLETIAPEDEYFEVDEVNEPNEETIDTATAADLNDEAEVSDTSEEIAFIDPAYTASPDHLDRRN